jgi:putative endonuclease
MENNHETGVAGEKVACQYLIDQGYSILDRNCRCGRGEIDIVARDGRHICFVEVKARRDLRHGYPREAVGLWKQQQIKNIAQIYIMKKKLYNESFRFDVVEIMLNEDDTAKSIVLIKDAFQ